MRQTQRASILSHWKADIKNSVCHRVPCVNYREHGRWTPLGLVRKPYKTRILYLISAVRATRLPSRHGPPTGHCNQTRQPHLMLRCEVSPRLIPVYNISALAPRECVLSCWLIQLIFIPTLPGLKWTPTPISSSAYSPSYAHRNSPSHPVPRGKSETNSPFQGVSECFLPYWISGSSRNVREWWKFLTCWL